MSSRVPVNTPRTPDQEVHSPDEGYVRRERDKADEEILQLAHGLEERGLDPKAALRWLADSVAKKS